MEYQEREYTSKKGFKCLDSSIFGKCRILSKEEIQEEMQQNECFEKCDNIPKSKFNFYIDAEICKYYATLKTNKQGRCIKL